MAQRPKSLAETKKKRGAPLKPSPNGSQVAPRRQNKLAITVPKVMQLKSEWWVYILRCSDGTLYTGITTNLERRTHQHNAGRAARYTRSRGPVVLVFHELQPDHGTALRREAAIKLCTRAAKQRLIATHTTQH